MKRKLVYVLLGLLLSGCVVVHDGYYHDGYRNGYYSNGYGYRGYYHDHGQ
ncbi:MAG TPA: hypothetical protein VMU79_14745 [Casimicrobiaceae bacterium]|nr:hypothetical protein [Casimicrobiaceae bacterium]